ncbi:hypothetical protein R69608_01416 [Paraburkholderia nemoris]|uniref:hypothetical protein n=1 Tax=Paraburkholderia nemoris TaxID=2793076 RepID=UPI0019123371|nr:hypothetical protein [Paraburkholderia nemoris]MBK5148040.1 hypothetical protein [Burkholderia sp. R-69608]CAE6876131.1 hypothetical protein R69608_01416 [Paraburkholderia nemoris]
MTTQRAIDLLAYAWRVIETEPGSIRRAGGPGFETEAAVVRAMEFAVNLMWQAASLADEPTRSGIAERAVKVENFIADLRIERDAWQQVPVLIAQDEARTATKH